MPISYNDGGTWRELIDVYYNDGGTWRTLDAVYYNDEGTWRKVHDSGAGSMVLLDNQNISATQNTAQSDPISAYHLFNDGHAEEEFNTAVGGPSTSTFNLPSNWWTTNPQASVGDDYEVQVTVSATNGIGTLSGDATGAWIPLTTDRSWTLTVTNPGASVTGERTLLVEIRDSATMTLQDSCLVNLSSEVL